MKKIVGINLFILFISVRLRWKKKGKRARREIRVISHEAEEIKNASDGILALGSGSLTPDEPTSKNRRPDVKLYSEPDTGAVHRLLNPSSTWGEGGGAVKFSVSGRHRGIERSIRKRNLDYHSKGIYYEKSCKIWNVVKLYIYIFSKRNLKFKIF